MHTASGKIDRRYRPPALPPAICWSTLTEPQLYKQYIASEGLTGPSRDEPSTISMESDGSLESSDSMYSENTPFRPANPKIDTFINRDCDLLWISEGLFANEKLPVRFNPDLFWSDTALWNDEQKTFANPPDLADAAETAGWLNRMGTRLGIRHGLVDPNQKKRVESYEDRVFICERSSQDFREGDTPRQSNIFVVDRSIPDRFTPRWPLVKALVVIASHSKQRESELIQTIIDQATIMFHSQLQRQYVVGLALWPGGPGDLDSMRFSVIAVDRAGAVCTAATPVIAYNPATLARVIFALTFGEKQFLGEDRKVITNPLTGHPQAIIVDGQVFTIIKKISASEYLFGRGTRVYIVKDQYGQFHILKDSWADASHDISEIDCLKNIASKVQSEGLDERSKILCPRFVAGEDHVSDTYEPRGRLRGNDVPRIRRRIVDGPIGDPITTYRSRVECLQVLLDVVDREQFSFRIY